MSRRCSEEKHINLLLIREKGKEYYVLIKNFNRFLWDHTLHRGRKNFSYYCLQDFSLEKILKCHFKEYSKISDIQRIKMPKKCESKYCSDVRKKIF